MFNIKIEKDKAQEMIAKLKEEKNLDNRYKIKRIDRFVIIPVLKITDKLSAFRADEKLEEQKPSRKGFKEILLENNTIPKEIATKLNSAYDVVGDIVIIRIDESYKRYYKEIGKALLLLHPNCKTVLNKLGEHKGIYRTQDMELVYGVDKRETIIKENGCMIKIDVEKVFCSTRLSEERKRIANLVNPDETIGIFFAGAGPFALAIAKNKKVKQIIAIELNEIATSYLKENIKLNRLEGIIIPVLGDVKEEARKYPNYFDRVVMPLPKSSELFLDSAMFSTKDKGFIHIYKFVDKNDPYTETEKEILKIAEENNARIEVIGKRVIRSYSPAIVQIVLDLKLHK